MTALSSGEAHRATGAPAGGHQADHGVLVDDVQEVEADFCLQMHFTNPLLKTEMIARAIEEFLAHYPAYDLLFSVTPVQTRLWGAMIRPVNHNPAIPLCTQDLPPLYEKNSNLYFFIRETLEARGNRIDERLLMFGIDRLEAWGIDEDLEFQIAKFLYQRRLEAEG